MRLFLMDPIDPSRSPANPRQGDCGKCKGYAACERFVGLDIAILRGHSEFRENHFSCRQLSLVCCLM